MEFSVDKTARPHDRFIGRVHEAGKAAGQVDMLIGRQGVPVLLEPDSDFIRRAPGASQLFQADRASEETCDPVRSLEIARDDKDWFMPSALTGQNGNIVVFIYLK